VSAVEAVRGTIRGALFDNLGLKVVSLLCALGFYAFIHGAETAERAIRVSVVSIMPSESANRELMTQLPTEVSVTLRGPRTKLDDLRSDDLGTIQLDLRTGRETRVDLDASMIHVPPSLTVEQIYPTSIDLRWDDVVSRSIGIQIARTGEPAPGFVVKGTPTVEPQAIVARGPRSVVDVIQSARAAPFDATGLGEGTFRRALALDKPPPLVGFDVESVVATVEIARELSTRRFERMKVEVVGLPRATTVPTAVNVIVTGTSEQIGKLAADLVLPRVEPKLVDATKPGSAYLDVLVDVPSRDGPPPRVEVEPPKVLVKW
jgi:hypothetical protein